jgi:diaminohydroxyphosphoribosylaminopyrimidine deaminase/5-amino-6-(5-phosphoribosylamino)uracil reductase
LKWAETQDGFIAPETKSEQKPVWITNEFSRQLVHKWRSEEQAILVGRQTVIDDNPKLTIRDWTGNNPIRIVLDQNNKISKESYIFDLQAKTFVLSKNEMDYSKNTDLQIVNFLYKHNIQSVIIEGGSATIQSFIDNNLWDEARVFIGNTLLEKGKKAPIIHLNYNEKKKIIADELLIFKNYD